MNSKSELFEKLKAEGPLSMAEAHLLDQSLAEQEGIRSVVRELEDDTPSMAWRSGLNERLLAVTPTPRKSWFSLRALAGLGTVAACTLALILVLRPEAPRPMSAPSVTVSESSVEQVLLDAHRSSSFALATGAGDGSAPTRTDTPAPVIHWTESDFESF